MVKKIKHSYNAKSGVDVIIGKEKITLHWSKEYDLFNCIVAKNKGVSPKNIPA